MTAVLGRYELVGRLGMGGMAEVWLARASGPSGFEKQVVVKRILPQLAGDPTVEELFKAEARIAARLDHPNLLQVFDFGREPDGALVLVMELVDGASLRAVVRAVKSGKPLDPRLIAKLLSLVCEGLHAAHELKGDRGQPLNLVHRDISPENILLAKSGAVKVADFGIARIEREVQLTKGDTFRGKIGYAAPEQLMGEPVTRQADVWAVGVTMFELLTGERPFLGENEAELVSATVHREARRVEQVRKDCPLGLAELVARCLERRPEKRWPTAHVLAEQLDEFVAWSGNPVRTADLGAILDQLGIQPHTVSTLGTPALPHPVSLPGTGPGTWVEPSTFEPVAELAMDGKLVPVGAALAARLDALVPSPDHDTPVGEPKPPEHDSSGAPELAREPAPRSSGGRLELVPLAVAVEPVGEAQRPPPPGRPVPLGAMLGGLGAAVLVALALTLGPKLLRTGALPPGALLIESSPTGAQVLLNGSAVGETPWAGENPAGGVTTLTLRRQGYDDAVLRLDGGVDWSGTLKLQRVKGGR
ncbi:MAG: serine/threonine protein kinase [Myxococcaceae bacterium]|nr:serine/threonine protein kinase [Myxococcaceae bacterium]